MYAETISRELSRLNICFKPQGIRHYGHFTVSFDSIFNNLFVNNKCVHKDGDVFVYIPSTNVIYKYDSEPIDTDEYYVLIFAYKPKVSKKPSITISSLPELINKDINKR